MVAESEVPLGTAEPVLFPGAPVVPKGTQCLDYPIFPALKRWAIFSEHKDAKYDPISPGVFKLSHYRSCLWRQECAITWGNEQLPTTCWLPFCSKSIQPE